MGRWWAPLSGERGGTAADMGSGGGKKACANASCGVTTTREWKRGWPLRSGGFALLCFSCGSAYESSVYCDSFHSEESGWRECYICNKRLHCGCIASESLLQLLDYGGVECASCARISRSNLIQNHEIPNGFGSLPTNNIGNLDSIAAENRVTGNGANDGKLVQLCRLMEARENNIFPLAKVGEGSADPGILSNGSQPSAGSYKFPSLEKRKTILDTGEICGSLSQPSLSMTLGAPSFTMNFVPFASGALKDKELGSPSSSFQQAPKSRSAPPKPSKSGTSASSDSNKVSPSEPRIARPPAEGRGKSQLLPRYWPRITDQELQQLSGDLNSKIVPLFEKVLSASDAGRIGRLVLPKACAEAYFPTISQSEGLPIRVQDIKGREWTFQFRFWPNNNSRMYVLEGVTPCIQSMQLQAGDTITFSKIDPGGRLVLGYRKATNNAADTQEDQASTILNADTDVGWNQTENQGVGTNTNSLLQGHQLAATAEKKKTRIIGPKNKKLLMNGEDAMELRLTWEEAQDLLRPPPNVKPTVIIIDDYEFEEYDEPPVFGKRTIFTTQPSGRQDQWAQCDECYKWRKLPVDALLPAKWLCSENIWDSIRCWCSAAEEMNPKDMDNLLWLSRDFKKRRTVESRLRPFHDAEPSGLDALASVAVLGENIGGLGEPSAGATTKHPRHRPGCTCIVCIQPPSGKGKHKPTCTCNVCMTVKRRFKTFILRKKKRQSERENEVFCKENLEDKDRPETNGTSSNKVVDANKLDIDGNQAMKQPDLPGTGSGQIDLNYCPNVERPSVVMQLESLSLDNGSKQDELGSSKSKSQGSMSPSTLPQTNGESLRQLSDHEAFLASIGWEQPNKGN